MRPSCCAKERGARDGDFHSRYRFEARIRKPTTAMAPPATSDVPRTPSSNVDEYDLVQTLRPAKSFHSKSLGESDKTGVQVSQESER